jgi:dihydroneopterin aldolase
MDEIQLNGLRLMGTHGVLAEEQTRAQPFEVDVTLSVDLTRASTSDVLEDTIDYGGVVSLVASVVEVEHFALLERLAGRTADVVLAHDDRIASVAVSVRKLRPPVPHDLASAGVRVVRSRS